MLNRLKRMVFKNDDPPEQLPIDEPGYEIVGKVASASEIKGNKEIPLPESNIVSKIKKVSRKKHDLIDKYDDKIIIGENDVGKDDNIKSNVKVITQKILPKLLTARLKSPHEFENLKKIIDHDIIIINYEEIALEAFEKIFLDFKRYMETLNYSLWMVDDNVILIVKSEVDIDKYKSESSIAKQDNNNQ
ncbi:hypothetical protein KKP97_04460 [Methanothermococcus sp. SCGC AD-155-C09]|nr:hypothetical protein [Methanothermococcus sp. SCGC AD-155-C09]